jgi:hypothetical protein
VKLDGCNSTSPETDFENIRKGDADEEEAHTTRCILPRILRPGCKSGCEAGREEQLPICERCGGPSERKKRGDGTWYHHSLCRRCRREPQQKKEKAEEDLVIHDERLNILLLSRYLHLAGLKTRNWQDAPKQTILERLEMMLSLVDDG